MIEIRDDIWKYRDKGYIVIPTNGYVKGNGQCVMGRGLASQCTNRYPTVPFQLGTKIISNGNHVHIFIKPLKMFSFPVKHNWWEKADLELIQQSCIELSTIATQVGADVFIPHVGCGNGQLSWDVVRPILDKFLTIDFWVVDK